MVGHDLQRGLDALRRALMEVLEPPVQTVQIYAEGAGPDPTRNAPWVLTETSEHAGKTTPAPRTGAHDDAEFATSSVEDEAEGTRLIALVELARNGDSEAFGQLYDHYKRASTGSCTTGSARCRWPRTSPPRRSSGRCAR